jgi:hypothetical protein
VPCSFNSYFNAIPTLLTVSNTWPMRWYFTCFQSSNNIWEVKTDHDDVETGVKEQDNNLYGTQEIIKRVRWEARINVGLPGHRHTMISLSPWFTRLSIWTCPHKTFRMGICQLGEIPYDIIKSVISCWTQLGCLHLLVQEAQSQPVYENQ